MTEKGKLSDKAKQSIKKRLNNYEKVYITSGKHKQITWKILLIYILLSIFSSIAYIFLHGLTWKIAVIFGTIVLALFPLFQLLKKKVQT